MRLHDIGFASYFIVFLWLLAIQEGLYNKKYQSLKENFIIYSFFSTNIAGLKSRVSTIINVLLPFWNELGEDEDLCIILEHRSYYDNANWPCWQHLMTSLGLAQVGSWSRLLLCLWNSINNVVMLDAHNKWTRRLFIGVTSGFLKRVVQEWVPRIAKMSCSRHMGENIIYRMALTSPPSSF